MSATTSTTPWPEEPAVPYPGQPAERDRDGVQRAATALTGLALLAGLAVAISPGAPSALAFALGISARTVESHVGAVLRKLQLTSRHEVTHWAVTRGLIGDDDPERG